MRLGYAHENELNGVLYLSETHDYSSSRIFACAVSLETGDISVLFGKSSMNNNRPVNVIDFINGEFIVCSKFHKLETQAITDAKLLRQQFIVEFSSPLEKYMSQKG